MDTVTAHASNVTDVQGAGFLPNEAPLAMTPASLRQKPPKAPRPFSFRFIAWRRAYIFIATLAMTAGGGYEMYQVVKVGGVTIMEGMVLALYVVLFAWIAFSFASALAGFIVLLVRKRDDLDMQSTVEMPALASKTAMLLPVYNEDAPHVIARLRAIYESVEETGQGSRFDWFVLSDTTDPTTWIAEERAFVQFRGECAAANAYYRHRANNEAKKSGNIADWVVRFGGSYDHMVILDADSLMAGATLVRLASAMERHPKAGLIQTLPVVVNATTLFARLQQFSGRLYGPLIAAGIAWWHGAEGNYWGHNAIIRVRAFAAAAGLPELRGRKPFGGHILSHDFVEAALMRRAGWGIHMAPTLGGSFEECPPSLLDFAVRDRRWCQGNLQHLAVLPTRGLHWVSRLHLLTGIGSYLTAPLWLIFLVFGILISLQAQFVRPEYFPKGFSLFPHWPAQDPIRAAWVFGGTMALLIVPKFLAYLLLLTQSRLRREFGGALRSLAGIVIETILSSLVAPIMMVFQSSAVADILLGRDAGWQVQRRGDGGVIRRELFRKYFAPTLLGLAMAISAYAISLPLLYWMSPVIIGLLLAIPTAFLTSSSFGFRASQLLVTPEDTHPPSVLVRANELGNMPQPPDEGALHTLFADETLLQAHLDALPHSNARKRGDVDPYLAVARAKLDDAHTLGEAISFLNARELYAALGHRETLLQAAALSQ